MALFFLTVGAVLTALKIAGIVALSWWAIAGITFAPMILSVLFVDAVFGSLVAFIGRK